MPRPGPRPYECVRRAWHSDRHQPIRGSLIQEIFRVASEVHGSATKKNKEWQEKLPVVVLKAEEIMYSKANSEAEYMDLQTLWSRVNDAIDTIIRRDESTETGNLLQPCIEAALHLGCTPRRTSRSQRNVNPRCYLSPASPEHNGTTSCVMENPHLGYNSSNIQQSSGCQNMAVAQNGCYAPSKLSLPSSSKSNMCLACPTPKGCSTFPLYHVSALPSSLNPNNMEPAVASNVRHLSLRNVDVSNEKNQLDMKKTGVEDCDLSLRLGPSTVSLSGYETNGTGEFREFGSEEAKFNELNKFYVLPRGKVDDTLGSSSANWSYEGRYEATRKRKADPTRELQDPCFSWKTKLPYRR